MKNRSLTRFAWVSISAAVITITLKTVAYLLTGSVGLLSDALESGVNLAAAIMALFMLKLSEKPPDDDHSYGHSKAEYFSSIVEGVLIIIAALSIGYTAIDRFIHPRPIEQAFIGLAVSILATVVNLIASIILLRAGKKYHSITLEADGHHIMTDVWTSVGVIAGVGLVALTNIQLLDPIIALLVAVNIVFTGISIMKKSALGLMDTSVSKEDLLRIKTILDTYKTKKVTYHGLMTRQSATRSFMSVHILVPGTWTVQKGHDVVDELELEICKSFPKMNVMTHLEPAEDSKSLKDISLDRV
jgi:cation diffusion facilitator family transporter